MKTIESRGLVYGLLTTAVLLAYFFVMKSVGLAHNINFRFFNAVIMFTGVFLAIRSYNNLKNGEVEYMKGSGVGILTSLVTAISFSAVITGYALTNPEFMQSIKSNEPQGAYINAWAIPIVLFIEAIASGMIFTFVTMQRYKTSNESEIEEKRDLSYGH